MGFLDKITETREVLGKVLRREKKADENAPEPGGNVPGSSGNTSRDSQSNLGGTPSGARTTFSVFASPTPAPETSASPQSNQLAPSGPAGAIPPVTTPAAAPLPGAPTSGDKQQPEPGSPTGKGPSSFSLADIFEEEVAVDENLRELAESMEDVKASDLAAELQQLLTELKG